MKRLRPVGALVAIAVILVYVGQLVALYLWEGMFSLQYNPIFDLSSRTCSQVDDLYSYRFRCSPGHLWSSLGTGAGGVLLLISGGLLLSGSRSRPLLMGRVLGTFLALSGLAFTIAGLTSYDGSGSLHTSAWLVAVAALWAGMLVCLYAGFRVSRRVGEPVAVAPSGRAATLLTVVLLVLSVSGAVLLRTATATAPAGMYLRIAVDPVLIWAVVLGAGLWARGADRSPGDRSGARERRRVAAAERDAALRKAAQE